MIRARCYFSELLLAIWIVSGTVARADSAAATESAGQLPTWADEPLTLPRCVELALKNTVTETGLLARVRAAEALLTQARTVPNPIFSYTAQDIGLITPAGPALLHQETLGFPLLFAYTRSQEAKVARAQVAQVTASVEEERRQLRMAIGRAFFGARMSGRLAEVETRAVATAAELVQQTHRRVAHGEVGASEVTRAQAEELEARRGAEQMQRRDELNRLALSILLGADRPFAVRLASEASVEPAQSRPESLPATVDSIHLAELLAQARSSHPELRAANAQVQRAMEQVALERRRVVPLSDLQLIAGARQNAAGIGGLLAVSMPLPLFDHNAGPRAGAQAQLTAARAALLSTERQLALEVTSAMRDWSGARRALAELVRPLVALREQSLLATRRQFVEGMATLLDVVTAQRDLLQAQRALAQAEHDAALAEWRLRLSLVAP